MKARHTKGNKIKIEIIDKLEKIEKINDLKILNEIIDKFVGNHGEQQSSQKASIEDVFKDSASEENLIGNLLKGARLREGLTQKDVERLAGISQNNLSAMENNKRPVGKSVAKKLAKIYKTDFKKFLL